MKVAIVGCGLLGHKRAQSIGPCRLVACVDSDVSRAHRLAEQYATCQAFETLEQMLQQVPDIDIVIIATPHNQLAKLTQRCVEAKKHVLVEKPAAYSTRALQPVIDAAATSGVLVRVGFNHRYHRAFRQARDIIDRGELGDLMFIRARYGHGGRLGYEKEWRAIPHISGGGELIDQGVHLIDLSRWFLGDFKSCEGFAHTYFWNIPVEDNGFLLLRTPDEQVAFLHASCTEWKNLFSFEIYGQKAKLHINGLGGSYGIESLAYYKMLPQMGPPETHIFEYPMADDSWAFEFAEFIDDIANNRTPRVNLYDAYAALEIVEKIYQRSQQGVTLG